jgi:hypothetical protein
VTNISFDESKREPASQEEIENDRLLLDKFVLPGKLSCSTPNLVEQAKLALQNQPFQLYNRNTCKEFHALLLELLQRFQESLDGLSICRDAGDVPTEGSDEFKGHLVAVMLSGYALQRIAKGTAFQMHLKTIQRLLGDHRRADAQKSVPAEWGKGQDEEQDGRDEDLEAVQPSVTREENVPMPLWKSYRDWLRLILVHFDAVDILVGYVTGPHFQYEAISIQILVAPPVDKALLPWRELFADSKLFPTTSPLSTKTNEEILKFLDDATSSKPEEYLKYANAAKSHWKRSEVASTIQRVNDLRSSTLPGWDGCTQKLLETLTDWTRCSSESSAQDDIAHTIQSLCDSAKFFADLATMRGFSGTLHCEACLASFLHHSAKGITIGGKYEDALTRMKVGYTISNLFLLSDPHFP